jgi:Uma2 family endonuclease
LFLFPVSRNNGPGLPAPEEVPMARPKSRLPASWTLADLLEHLGGLSPQRIPVHPPPGMATEQDVIDLEVHQDRLCELVDGVLVEKAYHFLESVLSARLGSDLLGYADEHDLGIVVAANAAYRLAPGLVRIPDASFVSWGRLPNRQVPDVAIADFAPDLVAELLNPLNTPREMERKLIDYFRAGVRLVWYLDFATRSAEVYTAPDRRVMLSEEQTLDGGDVLPGLALPLQQLFARVPRKVG